MPPWRSSSSRPRFASPVPAYPRALALSAAAVLLAVSATCCGGAPETFDDDAGDATPDSAGKDGHTPAHVHDAAGDTTDAAPMDAADEDQSADSPESGP